MLVLLRDTRPLRPRDRLEIEVSPITPASAPIELSGAMLRLAALHANSFAIDLLRLVRGERDVVDALILLCLHQSGGVSGEPRPLSIGAIANSLNMPFETVRRRISQMCTEGFCRQGPAGVVLADGAMASPAGHDVASAASRLLMDLYFNLRRGGALSELRPVRSLGCRPYPELEAAMFGLASAYFLRMLERMRAGGGNVVDGAVILAVYSANASPAPERQDPPKGIPSGVEPLSGELRPARVAEIADALGLPYETVRRHTKWLLAEGALIVRRRGLVVPRAALKHPVAIDLKTYNYACLLRLFEGCARLGLQPRWEVVLQDNLALERGEVGAA